MIKIAIFGGSFDPPHKGHQMIADLALKMLDIDKLIILPAFLNPFKKSMLASPQQRLSWCHKIFDNVADIEICDYEIRQHRPVYTSESLRYLQQNYCVAYLIIGSDNLSTITNWHEFEWLNREITWVVVDRGEDPLPTDMLREWIPLEIDLPVSSTQIRAGGSLEMIDPRIRAEVKELLQHKIRNNMTIDERIERIIIILDDKKAEEIEVFNLEGANYIAKRVVIANSLGGKHTRALFDHLKTTLKPLGEEFLCADESDQWVVADLGDILIHIMTPEYRQKYSLESFLSELNTTKA